MSEGKLNQLSSEQKRQLLLQALKAKGEQPEESHPLAPIQEGLLFVSRLQQESTQYNMPYLVRLSGKLDAARLEQSLHEIVRRHAPLRSVFVTGADGQPQQIFKPFAARPLETVDLRTLPVEEREAAARKQVEAMQSHVFDLTAGSPCRFQLVVLGEEEHWLLLVLHHVVFDGGSLGVLLQELQALYGSGSGFEKGESPLPPLKHSYAHFVRWQRKLWESGSMDGQLQYWQHQLRGSLPVLDLPTDRPWPALVTGRGAVYSFAVPATVSEALKNVSRQAGTTLFITLLAAFQTFLYRFTQQDDILVGTPVSLRSRSELEPLIGLLINTVVIRADLSKQPSFLELIRQVHQTALDAYSHQDVPFSKVVEALQPDRSHGRHPVFQAMFALNKATDAELQLGEIKTSLQECHQSTAKFDLDLGMVEGPDGLRAQFEYNTDVFDEATIARLADHFVCLLTAAAQNPATEVSLLPVLSEADRHRMLVEWNATEMALPQELVHLRVEQQAVRTPDAPAIVSREEQLTYRELNEKANQVAHFLQRQGVGPNVIVGVCMERSVHYIVAQLAVLKAGGAFVPMDPSHPDERLAFLIEDTHAAVVLTQQHLQKRLPQTGVRLLALDGALSEWAAESVENIAAPVTKEDMAYLIFTSGSTGVPKGVMVKHANMMNFVYWYIEAYEVTEKDRCSLLAGVGFDGIVMEIWPTLIMGATIYLPEDDEMRMSPSRLQEWLLRKRITVSYMPTPLGEAMLTLNWPADAPLRKVTVGGDKLYSFPPQKLPFELLNTYGPTETVVFCTHHTVPVRKESDRLPLIGYPIGNMRFYVVDEHLQPVPVGVPGHLLIGGAGVTLGYWRRPELTAEKFIADPFGDQPGERLYLTGDLVRYLPDGNLEFCGRIDQQVKVRGFRIELGEIEAVLGQHPSVREVIVITRETRPNDVRLVAYLRTDAAIERNVTELRAYLQKKLPDYMVPSAFVFLDEFPLTANGKIDRKALPEPQRPAAEETAFIPPSNTLQKDIAALWQQVLGIEQVGLDDNFFELGGHSLLLAKVHEQLGRQSLGIDLPMLEMFQYPTVRALADHITRKQKGDPQDAAHANGTQPASHSFSDLAGPDNHDIAVIGMASRVPGANDVQSFWANLQNGVDTIHRFTRDELLAAGWEPEVIDHPSYIPARGVVEGADTFDAAFFGIAPRDAEIMDPQQRVFMETAWTALEHAACDPERYAGRIGVFAGSGIGLYMIENLFRNQEYLNMVGVFQVVLHNEKDFLSSRLAYKFNLKGPAVTVSTACSTSLVAVHMACESLLHGDCEMALAGGVTLRTPLVQGYMYREGEIFSADGHCRAFDEKASGTIDSAGAGVVVLKKLSAALRDGDVIHAVIKGSAINNDGSLKVGFTAPSVDGQADVITQAMQRAGVHPETISYVETHGTGTVMGDPIEIAGLTQAYRRNGATERGYCAIGSVKTNVGHLDTAAGVTGLIKTVLALKHKQLPPSLHFENPNPKIDFANSPFYVNTSLQPWKADRGPRRAGVSSFGVGGTNAHAILEEAPRVEVQEAVNVRPWQVLTLSAHTETALETMTHNLLDHLRQGTDLQLPDIAHTLQVGRKAFKHRRIAVVRDVEDAVATLAGGTEQRLFDGRVSGQPDVVFLFSGQGSQYARMGAELYESEPIFQKEIDRCAELLQPELGLDLRTLLFPQPEQAEQAAAKLNETWLTQPALFTFEYALAKWWMSLGVHPQAMIGHSIGEFCAACLAGVFTLEEALRLVVVRGRLVQNCPRGSMMAVSLPETDTLPHLGTELSVAAINSPRSTVVSGPEEAIQALREKMTALGSECRPLHTSHAFHSAMMEEALQPFAEFLNGVTLRAPQIPFLSNVTGTWITPAQATDPSYWGQHLRQAVRFTDGLRELMADANRVFLEVGPGHTLATLARQHPDCGEGRLVLASTRHPRQQEADSAVLLKALGRLWAAGVVVKWDAFSASETRQRIELPTYPFERKRYWVEPTTRPVAATERAERREAAVTAEDVAHVEGMGAVEASAEFANEIEEVIAKVWQEVLGVERLRRDDNFFELGGDSLMASRVVHRLRDLLPVEVPLGALFEVSTLKGLAEKIEILVVELLSSMEEA